MEQLGNNNRNLIDVFDEVSAIFAASGVKITHSMLERMSPLLNGSQSFEEHRASLKAELEDAR